MNGSRQTLEIHPPCPTGEDGGHWSWSATHRPSRGPERTIRFEGGPRELERRSDRGDAFLLAFLHVAMLDGAPLRVRGAPVSPTLLANLEELQDAFHAWWGIHRIDVSAEAEREEPPDDDAPAIVAFSGGIDAAFTVRRHLTGSAGRRTRRLAAALMVHGFDIPRQDEAGFEGASARARALLEGTGLELLTIRTDLRFNGDLWGRSHGLALAGMLTLLSRGSAAGLIGSSGTYAPLVVPFGSNPITDRMMGSRSFAIVHDGTHASRLEKVGTLAEWPAACRHLRSCYRGTLRDRNCGRCPKCALSQALFRCFGVEPPCLDSPLPEAELCAALRDFPSHPASDPELVRMRRHLAERGVTGAWVEALEASLRSKGLA